MHSVFAGLIPRQRTLFSQLPISLLILPVKVKSTMNNPAGDILPRSLSPSLSHYLATLSTFSLLPTAATPADYFPPFVLARQRREKFNNNRHRRHFTSPMAQMERVGLRVRELGKEDGNFI